jgi:hypothetical protein
MIQLLAIASTLGCAAGQVMPHLLFPSPRTYLLHSILLRRLPCNDLPVRCAFGSVGVEWCFDCCTCKVGCHWSRYPPVYNLSRATAIQTCQAPGTSLDYIRDYGIVSYDWSNNAAVWHADHPNDCARHTVLTALSIALVRLTYFATGRCTCAGDQKMVDQAAISKRAAPDTNMCVHYTQPQIFAIIAINLS